MLNDPFHEEHSDFHHEFIEDEFEESYLEDIVGAENELIKDDFVETGVPEERLDDAVREDKLDDAIPETDGSVAENKLDWDRILENVDFNALDNVGEDVVKAETGDAGSVEDKVDDTKDADIEKRVEGIKLDDLPPDDLSDIAIERRDDLPDYLKDSEDAYDQKATLYDNNYDQVLEDAEKQEEASKRYRSPRVSRAWRRVKVGRGPRRYRSPIQPQSRVMRKGYIGGPGRYRR